MPRLGEIAIARSGDKGDSANVGVIAYTAAGYEWLCRELTSETVAEFFAPLGVRSVARYELPNLGAINFVLRGILAGGGSCSLRVDAQGKALGQALLEMPLSLSNEQLLAMRRPGSGAEYESFGVDESS